MFSLSGKTAVITGAGSGIGEAIARAFAKQGAHVEILDLDEAGAAKVAQEIRAGGSAAWQRCDVSDAAAADAAFESVWQKHQRLDILVNNAGIAHVGNVLNTTEADLDRIYRVNVKGVANCLRAGVEKMVAQGEGASS